MVPDELFIVSPRCKRFIGRRNGAGLFQRIARRRGEIVLECLGQVVSVAKIKVFAEIDLLEEVEQACLLLLY